MRTKKTIFLIFTLIVIFSCKSTKDKGVEINGIRWATRNVGKTPKTFAKDIEDFGGYYQWNKRTTNWTENWRYEITVRTWEMQNDPCPKGWRLPTLEELRLLVNADSEWAIINSVHGKLFGTIPNTIFLPAAGNRSFRAGELQNCNCGLYWSSTIGVKGIAWSLWFNRDEQFVTTNSSWSNGFSIRCVKAQ